MHRSDYQAEDDGIEQSKLIGEVRDPFDLISAAGLLSICRAKLLSAEIASSCALRACGCPCSADWMLATVKAPSALADGGDASAAQTISADAVRYSNGLHRIDFVFRRFLADDASLEARSNVIRALFFT